VATTPYPAGLSEHAITVGGVARKYRVHVPAALAGAPQALVFVLHGGGGLGLDVSNLGAHPLSVFRSVADREGFVVVYPGGLPASDGEAGWDDCRADNLVASGADDVGFLAALVEQVRGAYGLGASRVFMAGGSNGAMMTHAFGINRPDLLAAAATSSGSLAANPKTGPCATGPSSPLPMMIVHGTADPQMPWEGGCVANLGGNCSRGRVVSAQATRDRWLAANGLASSMPVQQVVEFVQDQAGSLFDAKPLHGCLVEVQPPMLVHGQRAQSGTFHACHPGSDASWRGDTYFLRPHIGRSPFRHPSRRRH
jgi:polyhydroxybutyrate depolymerase